MPTDTSQLSHSSSVSQPSRPVLLMAGGTGGHVFPALAIAKHLQSQGIAVCWLGTRRGLEARVVPAAEIEIKYISITGVRGKGLFSLLVAPLKISLAIWQSIRIIHVLRPAAVVGMGGFVTGPAGIAAWLLRIPLLIHEQNTVAGLTNRWLTRQAIHVMEAFPGTFPSSCHAIATGNPLRAEIMALAPKSRTVHKPLHVLVVGGSLGAQVLNEVVPLALQQLAGDIAVWHQTGTNQLTTTQTAYSNAPFNAQIEAFIEDMAIAYEWADVVICRAGALTVSELAQVGVASILVPYPHAVDDHQTSNARFLVDRGGAVLLPQTHFTVENLVKIMTEFHNKPIRLQIMSTAAHSCAIPKAVQLIVNLIVNCKT